jgi:hypothetical protein
MRRRFREKSVAGTIASLAAATMPGADKFTPSFNIKFMSVRRSAGKGGGGSEKSVALDGTA